jgi:apolipoprotein N-acyltransferase
MKTQELISEKSVSNAVATHNAGSAGMVPLWHSWCWLAAAVLSLLFADGRDTIALAAWVAPVCLLRVARTQPLWRGAGLVYVTLAIMRGITYRGMIPIPGIFYYLFLAVAALLATTPYLVDRVVSQKLGNGSRTLIFPSTLVLIQFANSYGAHGSWGSVAYTQAGNLPLLQSLSVFGLWGIAFLIGWFASAVNQLLEQGLRSRTSLKTAGLFAGVYGVIILSGSARLTLFPPHSDTVRTASLSPLKNAPFIPESLLNGVVQGTASDAQVHQFNSLAVAGQEELLSRTDREARAGAKIVFWSEGAATVLKQNEAAFLAKAQTLAVNDQIYLGVSMAVWTPQKQHPLENKIVLIDPSSKTAFEFLKARPTPGPEMASAQVSDGLLPLTTTSYGRLSAAICYDMDFPHLIAQAGRQRVDILLSPASDWAGIDPRHTQMAQFRAIEQGFNLLRQANLGLSAAYDYQGRTLATMDDGHSEDLALVAEIPTRGVHTVYARFGDWFAWACAIAVGVLVLGALRRTKQNFNSGIGAD